MNAKGSEQGRGPDAAEAVLDFWIGAGPQAWYKQDADFDAEIADRFAALWDQGRHDLLDETWLASARGALALIVLLDQFPRNMFRGDARAFASDDKALWVARRALEHGWDLETAGPARQFFYMPYMHSERLADQEECVRLFSERMDGDNVRHARAHREIIRRFGRFPYRNAALARETTAEEQAFMDDGGYASVLDDLRNA